MNTKTLRPNAGRHVVNPETGHALAENGERVELTTYWRRRLSDGDVVEVTPPARPARSAPRPAKQDVSETTK